LKRKRTRNPCQMRNLMTRIMIEPKYYRCAAVYVGPVLGWLHEHAVPLSFAVNYGNRSTADMVQLKLNTARTAGVSDTQSRATHVKLGSIFVAPFMT
jgi:hypothetical protein